MRRHALIILLEPCGRLNDWVCGARGGGVVWGFSRGFYGVIWGKGVNAGCHFGRHGSAQVLVGDTEVHMVLAPTVLRELMWSTQLPARLDAMSS